MERLRFGLILSVVLSALLISACQTGEGGSLIGDDESRQTQLPQIKVNLPPPPSFQKDNPPVTYPDGSFSIYGLRKDMKANLNQHRRVKGFLLEEYDCPECPDKKDKNCLCRKPHFWLSDRANGPKDKALLVTGYPKKDPKTKKKMKFVTGAQYVVSGVFSKTSGTGFSATDGLIIYSDATIMTAE